MSRNLIEDRWLYLLENSANPSREKIHVIIQCVSEVFQISFDETKKRNKNSRRAWARKAYYLFFRHYLAMIDEKIAKVFKKDRTTILYARKNFDEFCKKNPRFLVLFNQANSLIESKLKNKIISLKTEPSNLS